MLLLEKQFHGFFQILICDWAQKYLCAQSEASVYRTALVSFLHNAVYQQTRLFAVPRPVWFLQD